MPDVRIHPDQLRDAVATIDAAADALRGATANLTAAENAAGSALRSGSARHKVGTFARQWREEFEKIANLLTAYRDVVINAANAYSEGDAALADALAEIAPGAAGTEC